MHRVRLGGRFGTERAHRSGLPPVPLSRLRQGTARIAAGVYHVALGQSADSIALTAEASLAQRLFGN
jgi:hypothetical protein